ncbi:MAG: hypothetical protein KF817_10520 [Phycisphaeraceae bacterium]|nr:hypothetical protein [Phycisphaeraceae bacterium]
MFIAEITVHACPAFASVSGLSEAVGRNLVPVILAVTFVIWSSLITLRQILATSARERSRREIAAYIAEGSITAEQGERLIKARMESGPGST